MSRSNAREHGRLTETNGSLAMQALTETSSGRVESLANPPLRTPVTRPAVDEAGPRSVPSA